VALAVVEVMVRLVVQHLHQAKALRVAQALLMLEAVVEGQALLASQPQHPMRVMAVRVLAQQLLVSVFSTLVEVVVVLHLAQRLV
jgi:hypothetical protein